MRWINGETWEHKKERLSAWHRWFAWRPIMMGEVDGHHIKVWLEYVCRRGALHGGWDELWWEWEYSNLSPPKTNSQAAHASNGENNND